MDEEVLDECTICLFALADAVGGVGVGITPCGHRFHLACWTEFVTQTRPLFCPNCREDVNSYLDPVESVIRAEESVNLSSAPLSSGSVDASDSSSFTNYNTEQLPDLTGLVISEPGSLNHLIHDLDLQSIECGWEAGGQTNQCFTLSNSASMLHGMGVHGISGNMNSIKQVAVQIKRAILLALGNEPALRHNFLRLGRNQPIDSDVLQYIVSADSDFNKYAFVIFSAAVHESIQAWVGERYHTDLDTDDTLKRRNTITVLFSTEGFGVGHYTALIPMSEDVMARPTLDEISFHAERLGIRVNVNNHF